MPIYYPDILDQKSEPRTFSYSDNQVMLYALGIGFGDDPLNEAELPFVYEKNLRVVPSAATVLAAGAGMPTPSKMPEGHRPSTMNYALMLHGEQKTILHKPLPTNGTFTSQNKTIGAFDKGAGKGAVIVNENTWHDEKGELAVTLLSSGFYRGDGGFGGPTEGAPVPHTVPTRAPDKTVKYTTRPGQALLYRLSGDRNPLHSDPAVAKAAGFQVPILHGLCAYGITCRAVLEHMIDFDADSIYSHQVRFTSPVMPGETITVDLWRDGKEISFETRIESRGVTSIKNGLTVLR
jgi:acyl dehydratase